MFPPRFNRDLIFARAYYFAFMGGWGFILPFINLFYVSLGLSGTQIGTIGSASSVVGLIVSPSIVTIMVVRFIGGVAFSFMTIASVFLISSRTDPNETGTVLAIYTVTLASLVNILAAPVAGATFDTFGARWLYAFAVTG